MKRIAVPLQKFLTSTPGGIVVALPLYKQLPVSWFYNWLRMDKERCVGLVSTDGVYLPVAMSAIVKTALEKFPHWEHLVVFEHDMLPPLDAFERVAGYGEEHDIVGSLYFMHEPPHHAMALRQVSDAPKYEVLSAEEIRVMRAEPGLHQVDAVAMGFTAIRRRVFEQWDPAVPMWQPTPDIPGHDIHFCHEARKQGFSVWVDPAMSCGHLTEMSIDYSLAQAAALVSG